MTDAATKQHLLQLDDGRTLAVEEAGNLEGPPVFYLHGTPGSRLNRPAERIVYDLGIRLVTYDRPGYGDSTRLPGRRVADAAGDVQAVAQALNLSSIVVLGHSGGGPHAIACAAMLPVLVRRVAAVACSRPYDGTSGWFDGWPAATIDEFRVGLRGREALEHYLEPQASALEGPSGFHDLLSDLPDCDRAFVARHAVMTVMQPATDLAVKQGSGGWVDDDLAFMTDWAADVRDVTQPIRLWHGTRDTLVPVEQARQLAGMAPSVEFRAFASCGSGHALSNRQLQGGTRDHLRSRGQLEASLGELPRVLSLQREPP